MQCLDCWPRCGQGADGDMNYVLWVRRFVDVLALVQEQMCALAVAQQKRSVSGQVHG
jgi:hypothetical protein